MHKQRFENEFPNRCSFSNHRKGILKVSKTGEIQISADGDQAEKTIPENGENKMRTVIYNQGFNRIESQNIVRVEHAKLNSLLDEERRIFESFTQSAKKEVETNPRILVDVEGVWNRFSNHRVVQEIRRRIDCLVEAYPQFLRQVERVRSRLQERFFAVLNTIRYAAQNSILSN